MGHLPPRRYRSAGGDRRRPHHFRLHFAVFDPVHLRCHWPSPAGGYPAPERGSRLRHRRHGKRQCFLLRGPGSPGQSEVSRPEPSRESIVRTEAVMGTLITIEVVIPPATASTPAREAIERAFGWFREIEN